MRLTHFPYEIFLIWTGFCPTFSYYFDETLNPIANSSCMPPDSDVDSEARRRPTSVESKNTFALPNSWPSINWILAQTAYISRLGSGLQLDCVHVQISLLSDEVSRTIDIGIEERRKKSTQGRHRSGKGASYST